MKIIVDPFDVEIVYVEQDDGSLRPMYLGNFETDFVNFEEGDPEDGGANDG